MAETSRLCPKCDSTKLLSPQSAVRSLATLIGCTPWQLASRGVITILYACLVLVTPSTAQTTERTHPDVAAILEKVSNLYSVKEYELVADGTQTDPKTGVRHPFHMVMAFKGPNRYRPEGTGPGVGFGALNASGGMLIVEDGASLWFYSPKENQ